MPPSQILKAAARSHVMEKPALKTESVWDYPRPPRAERSPRRIQVFYAGMLVASTERAVRVLETSHPPVYYVPREDVRVEFVTPSNRHSFCEFKGSASYWNLEVNGRLSTDAAWSYEHPSAGFESIAGYLAFYPSKVDACFVDGELVQAQASTFYGGWVTSDITGPFKGAPGTESW